MDPASIALSMMSMQSALNQTNLGVALMRMNAQAQESVVQLLQSSAQSGQAASLPPGVGQNLNITV